MKKSLTLNKKGIPLSRKMPILIGHLFALNNPEEQKR